MHRVPDGKQSKRRQRRTLLAGLLATAGTATVSVLLLAAGVDRDVAAAADGQGPRPEAASPIYAEAAEAGTWWAPGDDRVFPKTLDYRNETGVVRTLNMAGPTESAGHPFFEALGPNGRACVTCHQPTDGMTLSVKTIQKRWRDTNGKDPLFAAIDGSNCPSLPQDKKSSHSILLERGAFRVFRPWPPKAPDGSPMEAEFRVEVVRDPTGCNTDPDYGLKSESPTISVFRRPRPATNIKYLTAVGFPFEPKNGLPLPRDPETGKQTSGNLLADARQRTLKGQARDALRDHMEVYGDPGAETLDRIIAFMKQLYTAQIYDIEGGDLRGAGAKGGPMTLATSDGGVLNSGSTRPMWDEFQSWLDRPAKELGETPAQRAFRKSVARGVDLFRNRTFLISDNAGITSMTFGNPVRNDCNFCHNMYRFGNDVAPGQVDLGTTTEPYAEPAPDLPLFKLTCKEGYDPHPHYGRVVYTTDPGFALTTGKCEDIGKITIQSMRGLAARPPYFVNGFADTIREIVDYYDERYRMELTEQEKQDLTNLMRVL